MAEVAGSPGDAGAVRLEMVARRGGRHPGLEVSELEIARGGPSYTIDTVRELEAPEGLRRPWVIVGSDLSKTLGSWERSEELPAADFFDEGEPTMTQGPRGPPVRLELRAPCRSCSWPTSADLKLADLEALDAGHRATRPSPTESAPVRPPAAATSCQGWFRHGPQGTRPAGESRGSAVRLPAGREPR